MTNRIDTQPVQTYFSHSYRAEDRNVNLFFWRLFSREGFFFTVDPKSERAFIPHLERMIRFSDCFVAIVTRRLEEVSSIGNVVLPQPQVVWTHSPYIQLENRLAIRAGKPRLVFVESGLNASLFGSLEEVHVFDRDVLDKREKTFGSWVQEFAAVVRDYKSYADRILHPTRKAGIMLDLDEGGDVYTAEVLRSIRAALQAGGYTTVTISPHISDDQQFIQELADTELLISEIREPFVTPVALAFTHARFLPTIRICWLKPGEEREAVNLPDFLTGYRVGDTDPLVTWRTQDKLVLELIRHMQKFQQTRTLFDTFDKGQRYFLSAGRREAEVFISNAHTLNDLALELVRGFQTVNIQFFHYQAAMRIGYAWQDELARKLNECDVFIALISDEYLTSKWCQYELEQAFRRWQNNEVVILPYLITQTRLPDLIKDHIQCAFMHNMKPQEIVRTIVETVDKYLTEEEQTPAAVRSRVVEFDRALERTAIVSSTSDFIEVVEETVRSMARRIDVERDPSSSAQLVDGMCRVDIKIERILDLPDFPKVIPLLFSQSPIIRHSDIEAIKHLLLKQPKRVALIVLPGDKVQDAQQALDTRIRKTHACDVVLLGHAELKSIMRNSKPDEALRKAVLAQVNILNYSPFVVTGPVPDHIFFGREPELREVSEHALTASYAVIGGRRIGKSSLLGRLHRVHLPDAGFRTLYHTCSTTPAYDILLAAAIRDWRPELPVDTPATFGDLLQSPPDDKPLVLLLDEADKLVPADRANGWPLFNALRALANSRRAQVVLSGERTLRDALRDPKSPLFNFANEMLLGPLDYCAVEELVTRPMKQLEIELVDEKAIVDRIWAFTSGHPNVVQRLCRRLIERLNELGTRRITLDDVNAVIEDPGFQREDFLSTYWEAATLLEKIISLLMADDENVRTLRAARQALAERCNLRPKAREVDDALQRLVDLRSILKRTPTGYEFAVEAFPRVVAGTMTLDDMLEILTEEYQEQGE